MDIGEAHTYNEILLSNKKNEILPPATTWMDMYVREYYGIMGAMLSNISQVEKEKYGIA